MPSEGSQTQADKQKQEGANKIPPASHTLMDLIITMSIYLPHSSLSTLFNMAALALSTKSNDPQLQKKAYKLIPRLAESTIGQQALRERNPELQQLFLATAEKTPAAVRHDRLQALSQLVAFLPASDLHFIPSVLSEVVMACKETNEKARTAAFDLLVQMARTIEGAPEGTTVRTSLVPHMPSDSALTPATISEFFTMVSAGLAGSTPHMVSASITALARLTFEFHSQLPKEVLADVVQTIDLFLTSNNREIVRSVLGFVKVAVTSLSADLILPRLENLIPSLMVWSHEHSGRLRAKVKNILERMIRKFGFAEIEKWTPEADRKLVVHIRKEREKRKRKKAEAQGETDISQSRRNKFENEFDEALHSSSSEDFASDSDDAVSSKKERGKQQRQYIRERESSPLDLLAPSALANISSTKPVKFRDPKTPKAKTDPDGKLILRGDDDDAADDEDVIMEGDSNMRAEGGAGVNSYLEAVSGPDAVRKGQRGKLKVSSGMKKADRKTAKEFDVDEDMEEEIVEGVKKARKEKMKGLERRSDGKVAKGKFGAQRRGLGQGKMSRGGGGGGGGGGHAGGRKMASGGTKFKGSGIRRR
jgi:ribosomal RNA-processing protein 12